MVLKGQRRGLPLSAAGLDEIVAGAVYVLAHAAKLGQRPFHAWAPLPPPVTLVTDCSATDDQIRPFTDAGIEVVTV